MAQLHQIKSNQPKSKRKRIGRGGKRGTYSGHGMKGQKARAGARIRPGFRGGDTPIWKLFKKQRGSTKKVEINHSTFRVIATKPATINLGLLQKHFNDGETVSKKSLLKKQLIATGRHGVKILADGEFSKKLKFEAVNLSKSALVKIEKAGSQVLTAK